MYNVSQKCNREYAYYLPIFVDVLFFTNASQSLQLEISWSSQHALHGYRLLTLTPGRVFMLWSSFCAASAAFLVKNVTKQQPEMRESSAVNTGGQTAPAPCL